MTVLVTGGAGYVGSVTVRSLIEAGYDVVVADDLSTGFRKAVHPKAGFCRLDIRDRESLDRLFRQERIDVVLHFSGYSRVEESMGDPLGYYGNNAVTGCTIRSETAPRREGDPLEQVASSEKARRALGWKPAFDTIEAMISTAWNWHRKHPDGYRTHDSGIDKERS